MIVMVTSGAEAQTAAFLALMSRSFEVRRSPGMVR
jgi:hypothetical protein